MYSNKFIKDFYDELKTNQEELILNKYDQCGGFSITDKQIKILNMQYDLNKLKDDIRFSIENKMKNIIGIIEQKGGGFPDKKNNNLKNNNLKNNIKALTVIINKNYNEEKKMLKNIKKQQEYIKKGKLGFLSKFQEKFKKNLNNVYDNNKKIKSKEIEINKSFNNFDKNIKYIIQNKLSKDKKDVSKITYNKFKALLKKIK
tara:strand:- start:9549 stop:10151 length:603 start_codon:yes stop_codon:yes gene_type:complete